MMANRSLVFAVGLTVVAVVGFSACAAVRKVTYPPDFSYLSTKQVRTTMGAFASGVARLDMLLSESDDNFAQRREAIILQLKKMEKLSESLGAGYQKTNHLLIDEHIDEFRADVRGARLAAEQEPPSYYLAGRLTGSCTACHMNR
ncbi:MAG: hypothetical protein OEU36_08095 [Gammaproteobacteria bacterium]|nr:hypothetical protein [Gammaproteobacteria bacterium]